MRPMPSLNPTEGLDGESLKEKGESPLLSSSVGNPRTLEPHSFSSGSVSISNQVRM